MAKIVAVVAAAGSGVRMGGAQPKQYVMLRGKAMLWHSMTALLRHEKIARVAVVIDEFDRHWDSVASSLPECTVLRCGGASRAHSVRNALQAVRASMADEDWILVHDAARPCLDRALLDRLFHELLTDEVGGLLAVPLRDTLKRATPAGRVAHTHPREGYWQAQTPQLFRYGLLLRALTQMDLSTVTDEASAVEALGLQPKLVQGSVRNLKVTYPEDVALAEQFLTP